MNAHELLCIATWIVNRIPAERDNVEISDAYAILDELIGDSISFETARDIANSWQWETIQHILGIHDK